MKALMNTLMLSCTKATGLIEKKSLDGLSGTENIRLSMHTAMCNACKQYQRQSILLNKAIVNHLYAPPDWLTEKNLKLGSHARLRMQNEIEKNTGKY
jgi:hypothetical protein